MEYFINKVFPDKKQSNYRRSTYKTFLLSKINKKYCYSCKNILGASEFHSNSSRIDNLASICKSCEKVLQRRIAPNRQANRRFAQLHRTPKWSETALIRQFYKDRPKGYHVDHIIPLQGRLVSGLHVLANLQYLPAIENLSKNNSYTIN